MQISYHSALTKIQKLQYLKKKKTFFCTGRYVPKLAGTAGIFFGMKQRGYTYRFTCWYGIFWLYRPVRYGIYSLVSTPHKSWAVGLIYSTSKGYVNQYWEKKYMWLYRKYTTHGQELHVSYSVTIACKCCIILDFSRIWLWKIHKNYMWESILSVPNVAVSWLSNNFY